MTGYLKWRVASLLRVGDLECGLPFGITYKVGTYYIKVSIYLCMYLESTTLETNEKAPPVIADPYVIGTFSLLVNVLPCLIS